MDEPVNVLVISGSMGTGKTTVMAEISDLLTASNVAHAAIDLDVLSIVHPSEGANANLGFQNLQSVWNNYSKAGIRRLVIATALETAAERERLTQLGPGALIVVCRLRAALETMQQRIRMREPGMLQENFVSRAAELEALLDATHVEDFNIVNEKRSVTEVAREVLTRSGWLR